MGSTSGGYPTLEFEALIVIMILMKNIRQGFTLIEMLIVIAVIAILSSAVLVGLSPVRSGARDSRRITDLRQAQNGLELYFNKCGYYPGPSQPAGCTGFGSAATDWAALTTAITGSNIGVNRMPSDPSGGKTYFYGANAAGSSYVIGAILEDANNSALRSGDDADGFLYGVNCDDPMYCIQF